jgi:hypothetical protein
MNPPATYCAWRGSPAQSDDCIESACDLSCHTQSCLAGRRRECEKRLSASDAEVFPATRLFWECHCEENYIHAYYQPDCPACQTARDEGLPAPISTVLLLANEWRLDQGLVDLLDEMPPDRWLDEPDEGPLVEQYENAARLDDDWLESAFEDRISGWGDEF